MRAFLGIESLQNNPDRLSTNIPMDVPKPASKFALKRGYIIASHSWEGGFIIPVQIDQTFKSLLFAAGKEPVNGAFFIGLEMIFKKAGAQVTSDGIDRRFIIFWFQAACDKILLF